MRRNSFSFFLVVCVAGLALAATGCTKLKARDLLNKGVQAYKGGQTERAIEFFKQAKELDPELLNAGLYLATAYAGQYIPGAPSAENIRMGQQAIAEFEEVLKKDANNLSAIDGIGSILFNMAGTPFDLKKFEESKRYHTRHIQIQPSDKEPYYWIGVINWTLAYRGNKEFRLAYNSSNPRRPLKEEDALPAQLRGEFISNYGAIVNEGIEHLRRATELDPEYADAIAYLNLLYRQKADQAASTQERQQLIAQADALQDKVKEIRQRQATTPTS